MYSKDTSEGKNSIIVSWGKILKFYENSIHSLVRLGGSWIALAKIYLWENQYLT